MFGQGRPHRRRRLLSRRWFTTFIVGTIGPIAIALCAAAAPRTSLGAEPIDIRVRIAWGGGEARPWQGTIRISEGTLSDVTPLGLEVDEPGSLLLTDATTIRVCGRGPRSYDGCDVRVQGPPNALLLVQLGADATATSAPLEIPLARVVREFPQFELDDRKNRLLAQRSPGDALRVNFSHPSLVFTPGEKFQLEVQPQQLELTAGTTYLLSAALGPARTEENVWSEEREVKIEEAGIAKAIPLVVPLPEQEGVYDLRLALYPKRLTSSIVRGKALATRKVQLVTVGNVKHAAPSQSPWQNVYEFDPANPKWWERMAVLPAWTRLPTVPRPVESGPAGARAHLGRTWVELSRNGWQAYPLSIAVPGTPHVIEIEYPSDIEQTLGISLVEPNAAGYVGPIGLDSGIEVARPEAGHKAGTSRHRLIVWPQSKTPYLLLANRRDDRPAIFGKIAVQTGPLSLPPLAIPPSNFATRTLVAYYDQPLFAENFSAPEALEPINRRGFDDWLTFAAGGVRLVETLQHSGYGAVVLTAACQGSAIYPSRLLEPTPKHDSGVFFESGQDAVRKDVLELLFRLCDRNGLVLMPGVQFAGPLPELEAMREAGGPEVAGLEPIGPDGRTPLERNGGQGPSNVYYNALDERVQKAMIAVVAELAERYGHHASFGGIAVQLNAESQAVLPDETCSLDDVTFARFLAETSTEYPGGDQTPMARWGFVRRSAAQTWLDWRSEKLAGMYRGMREVVTRQRAGAKLYLTTGNLLSSRQLQMVLRPELPAKDTVTEVLPLVGLDLRRLEDSGIIIPRPQRIVASSAPQARDQEQHWNRHPAMDALFARVAHGGAMHYFVPAPQRMPDFDSISPFGADKTRTLLISQIAPADAAYRERFVESIARLDATLMIDGGWMLPLGQQAALTPLAKVYRRLPAEPFQTAPRQDQAQGMIVRTLAKGDKTYFYAVNPTPWPLSAQIQFAGPPSLRLTPYCDERQANLQPNEGGATWTVEMEPFDLVGGELSSGSVKVVSWSANLPANAGAALAEQSRDITFRVTYLKKEPHFLPLANASFEERGGEGTIFQWIHARGTGMVVELDRTRGGSSLNSLHMAHRGAVKPVWIRSSPIPTPTTGRIQMTAKIRIADADRQPPLRLAIEGRLEGQVYYRFIPVGLKSREGDAEAPPLGTEWATYSISLTNLPVSGLTGLCVGFDLMGDGEAWIDDVRVRDVWLQDDEADDLLKSAATATFQARNGSINECRLFLEGYWPSFLRRHVPLPDGREVLPNAAAAVGPINAPPIAGRPTPMAGPPSDSGKKANWLERTAERNKNWWPSWMKWK